MGHVLIEKGANLRIAPSHKFMAVLHNGLNDYHSLNLTQYVVHYHLQEVEKGIAEILKISEIHKYNYQFQHNHFDGS